MNTIKLHHFSRLLLVTALFISGCGSVKVKNRDVEKTPGIENWTHFGGSVARTNYRDFTLAPPFDNIWTYKASSALGKALLVVDGLLYFVSLDGRFDVVDLAKGKRIGRKKLSLPVETYCAYYDNQIVFAAAIGTRTLSRYDLHSGKFLWKVNAGFISGQPVLTEEGVFVAGQFNFVAKYDWESGAQKWIFDTEEQIHSSPSVKDNILVVGSDNGLIYALNTADGELIWTSETGAAIYAAPVIRGNSVYIGATDSVFYSFNVKDGGMNWDFAVPAPIYETAATDGENVIFGCTDGTLYCLDPAYGHVKWEYRVSSVVSTSPVIAGDVVFFGSLDQNYYCLNLQDGTELWRFRARGRVRTAPVVWKEYLIGASEDKFIYAFTRSDSLNISLNSRD
jgi:outer membrane protein assembly factor BamB